MYRKKKRRWYRNKKIAKKKIGIHNLLGNKGFHKVHPAGSYKKGKKKHNHKRAYCPTKELIIS